MPNRCSKGKNCSSTCIAQDKKCAVELSPQLSKSLSAAKEEIEKTVQTTLEKKFKEIGRITTEEQAIDWLDKNYKRLSTEGMQETYGGPGQRGNINSKVWLIGQEAYADPGREYKDNKRVTDPVALVNVLKLHKELYDAAKSVAPKENVTTGVENFLGNKPFKLGNDATVENWKKQNGSSYYGKLGRILDSLGVSGNLAAGNISSLLQPPGQKGISSIAKMLKENGRDPKKFAGGSLLNNQTWYNFSSKNRAPLIAKAIEKYKPKLVYMGQQSKPEDSKGFNRLLYYLAKETKSKPYHVNHDGKDYKWLIVEHPNNQKTVVLNGWHPTAIGKQAVKVSDRKFLVGLVKSLQDTGKPPEGVSAKLIEESVKENVLR